MPTPDHVIFAPGVDFGTVRGSDSAAQINHLRAHIDNHIGTQIRSVGFREVDGEQKRHHESPFPLAIMTCIALEALGSIFLTEEAGTTDGRTVFTHACNEIDSALYRPAKKGFFGDLKKQFPEFDFKKCYSVADLLYKTFRNKMAHDYMSGCIYLTGEDADKWDYDTAWLMLNPFWFAEETFNLIPKFFDSIQESGDRIKSCEKYVALLLRN